MRIFCIVVPVYKNELNIPTLIDDLNKLRESVREAKLKVTFVIDGSPDDSYGAIKKIAHRAKFPIKLITLSRNFGAVVAVRAGLSCSEGDFFAVMAADSQEPIELYTKFFQKFNEGFDIAVGQRESRIDSHFVKLFATVGWWIYKRFIFKEMPSGGVDVFGCTDRVRKKLIVLKEKNSSLVGELYWVGFRKASVLYARKERLIGKSAWNFFKSLRYFLDSCFNFSDLPIRLLWILGLVGVILSTFLGASIVINKVFIGSSVPGYSMIVITVLFFGSINLIGIGIVGEYVVRAFENSKRRPEYIIESEEFFDFS